jgi:PAS domain S-box-containing protein
MIIQFIYNKEETPVIKMRPDPLISDAGKDNQKTREQLLTELAGLQGIVTALKDEQAGYNRIVGMLDGIAEPLLILDDATRIIYANPAAGRLLDTGHEQLPGNHLRDVYPGGISTLFYNVYKRVVADRNPASFEQKFRRDKWLEVNLYPVVGGMVMLFHDITVRRHKDEIPRLALALLHHLKENVFLLRSDGRLFHVNDETRNSLGYSTNELIRMSIFDLVPQAHLGEWHDILDRIRQKGSTTFESVLRAKDGREFPVDVYANYIELYGHEYYAVSARDITERKNIDAVLEKYQLFSENTRDIVLFVRRDGRITEANEAAVKVYGYTREELLSLTIYDLRASDPGHDVDEQMDTAFDSGILFETLHHRKDGSMFPVEVNSQGRIIDGQKVMLSIVRDITDRKRAEEALQVAKAQAELYVDLMGHDISNMNQIGIGYLEMLLDHPGIDQYEREMLQKSLASLESSSKLIGNVQKLQRASTEGISLKAINVTDVLENVIREFRQRPGKELTIDFRRTGDCLASANELLKDLFVNLIDNAIKHSRPDQPLTIGISADNVAGRGKTYCRFIIEDNGPGIPDATKVKLFNRFARGDTKARGSGLGLYLVRTLVEHYKGRIAVEDRVPGDYRQGVRFVVSIPSCDT